MNYSVTSVVVRYAPCINFLTFSTYSSKLLKGFSPNLVWSIIGTEGSGTYNYWHLIMHRSYKMFAIGELLFVQSLLQYMMMFQLSVVHPPIVRNFVSPDCNIPETLNADISSKIDTMFAAKGKLVTVRMLHLSVSIGCRSQYTGDSHHRYAYRRPYKPIQRPPSHH